jgi:hypothetical protein
VELEQSSVAAAEPTAVAPVPSTPDAKLSPECAPAASLSWLLACQKLSAHPID